MSKPGKAAKYRSLLYIPSNKQKFIDKAQARGADALILDLEDSILQSEKDSARISCATAIGTLKDGPSDIVVRVNGDFRTLIRDLEAVVQPGLQAVMIPKCDYPKKCVIVDELLSQLEAEANMAVGCIGIIPLLESPEGFFNAEQIAKASDRNIAILLGGEDFATSCDIEPTPETLLMARQQIVFAARAASISPLGLLDTATNYSDIDYMISIAKRASQFGFAGSTCVHPAVVPVLNQAFAPSCADIEHARQVITALQSVEEKGGGVATLNGKMIDAPIKARALKVLARAGKSNLKIS